MSYTEGIWEVKTGRTPYYTKAEVRTGDEKDGNGNYTKMGQLIAVCYGKNTVANAHLISAAPAMAQVLEILTTILTQPLYMQKEELQKVFGADFNDLTEAYSNGCKALAKVEGKS